MLLSLCAAKARGVSSASQRPACTPAHLRQLVLRQRTLAARQRQRVLPVCHLGRQLLRPGLLLHQQLLRVRHLLLQAIQRASQLCRLLLRGRRIRALHLQLLLQLPQLLLAGSLGLLVAADGCNQPLRLLLQLLHGGMATSDAVS